MTAAPLLPTRIGWIVGLLAALTVGTLLGAGLWPAPRLLALAVGLSGTALIVAVTFAVRQHRLTKQIATTVPAGDSRHHVTLQSIGDGVIVCDREGRVELLNPVAALLTGWKQEQALGRKIGDVFRILQEGTREPVESPVARVLRDEEQTGLDDSTILLAKDGTERVIADSCAPVRDAYGAIIGVVLVFRDHSKERDLQRDLEASHALLHAVVDSSPDAIVAKDREGRYTLFNPAAARLAGVNAEEVLGRDDRRLLPADQARAVMASDRLILESGAAQTGEESLIGADGTVHHVRSAKGPLRDPAGRVTGLWGVAHDITQRKRVERASRDHAQRLQLAIETTRLGVWEWNVRTNQVKWSDEMFHIYGLEPTADGFVEYSQWYSAVFPEEVVRQDSILRDTVARRGKSTRAFHIRRIRDGEIRHIEAHEAVRLDDAGEVEWVVGTNLDVTHRTQMDEALQEERGRLASTILAADVGTWEWNVQTGATVFNERWAGILGCTLAELQPVTIDTCLRLAHPDDLKVSGELLEKHFRRELPLYSCEARMRHKDGHWVWVLARGRVTTWTPDGKPLVMQGTHADITARKEAEQQLRDLNRNLESVVAARTAALQANEERMALCFQATQDGIWDWNIVTDEVFYSARYKAMLGYGDTELESHVSTWKRLLHPEDLARAIETVAAAIRGEREYVMEFRMRHKAGHYLHILSRGTLIRRGAAGTVERIVGTHFDLTERNRAQAELEQARNTLVEAQRIGGLGSFEYVAATRTTVWSEEVYRIFGLDPTGPSPAYDAMLAQCIHPDDAAQLHEAFTTALTGLQVYELEHRIVRPDGSVRWVRDRAQPYVDENGGLLRYVGTTLDITEHKLAEAAIRESELRFRTVIEHSRDGINLLDLHTRRYVLMSPAQVQQTGFSRDEINNISAEEVLARIHPDDRHLSQEQQQRVLQGKPAAAAVEYRWQVKCGEYRWFSDSRALVRNSNGAPIALVGVSRDITERKRQDEELRLYREHLEELIQKRTIELQAAGDKIKAERQRFLDMLETLPVMVVIIRSDYLIEWANRAFRDAMGDFAGRRCHESQFGRPQPCQECQAFIPLQSGQPHHWEWTLPDGRTFDIYNFPFLAADGSPAVLEMDIDITAQRQAQAEVEKVNVTLRESEARFRRLVETSFNWVWQVDTHGRYTHVGQQVQGILGYQPAELLGRQPLEFMSPAEASRMADGFRDMGRSPRGVEAFEHVFRHHDGHEVIVESNATPIFAPDGKWRGYAGVTRDITARRQAELNLRLRGTALEAADNAIIIAAADGTIAWANPAFARASGWDVSEVAGRKLRELLDSGQYDAGFYEEMSRILQSGRTWRGEVMNRRKDGKLRTGDLTITPVLDAQGTVRHFVIINQDITDRKVTEAQRRHMQRMESIGTLAGGVAHDLNNILAPILIVPDLLKPRLADESDKQLLEMVRQSAKRGAEIIRQLLTFSRRMEGERITVQPRHILREVMAILRATIPHEIVLEFLIPPSLRQVKADPTQLHQVLINLGVNARDAMPAGGRLTVRAIDVTMEPGAPELPPGIAPGRFVLFEVEDTGHGIPVEIRDRIFDPFFTTKPVDKGTGLGLSTVQGIVSTHGGFITVESTVGRGTTFRVFLPAVDAVAAPEPAATAAPLATGKGRTVLVVEDEPNVREALRAGLETHGFRVFTATNGEEGVGRFRELGPQIDVVLTDLMMPVMNGASLALALRELAPRLPIIAISGLGADRYAGDLAGAGVTRVLPKPFTIEAAVEAITDSLRPPA